MGWTDPRRVTGGPGGRWVDVTEWPADRAPDVRQTVTDQAVSEPDERPAGRPHTAGTDPTCRVCQAMRRRNTADYEDDR